MSAGDKVFSITELSRTGQGQLVDTPVSFRWDSDSQSAPVSSWDFSLKQRTVREEYPGASEPVEQVLGPSFQPFTVSGRWDDKYGGQGFAYDTWRAFEQLVARGSLVRVSFEKVSVDGIITDVNFKYKRESLIFWSFTLSPHHRCNTTPLGSKLRAPTPLKSPRDYYGVMLAVVNSAVQAHNAGPQLNMQPNLYETTAAAIDGLVNKVAEIGAVVDQVYTPVQTTVNGLARLAQGFGSIQGVANNAINSVVNLKSDASLAFSTAIDTLNFEVWTRTIAAQSRLLLLAGLVGKEDFDKRVQPDAIRIYHPHAGESLYSVSQKFYGTPFRWRDIATRNGITSMEFTGSETLIIPERT